MPTLLVDTLKFDFDATVAAQIYDQWQHYSQVWNAPPCSQKAVDVVAVEGFPPSSVTWLLEAKDFRIITTPPRPSDLAGLAQTVADKVAHTLAGLTDASGNAVTPGEKQHATAALTAAKQRVVLHLEPHTGTHSRLFPSGFAASVLQQLRRLVQQIDANPLVLNISNTPASRVPWTVS